MKSDELPTGIHRRHTCSCPAFRSDDMTVCACRPRYQAQAGHRRARQTRTFATLAETKRWRAQVELETADLRGRGAALTVRAAGERWLAAMVAGEALTRSGSRYRPSTLAGYRFGLREVVFPQIGSQRLNAVTRGDVLALVGKLQTEGRAPSTIRNAVVPLRALYRYAADLELTARNPTRGIPIAGLAQARRERFATPAEARALLDALPERDRAVWATAFYAGLRRGELMALRWSDVDLTAGELHVKQAYDLIGQKIGLTKTDSSRRTVPIGEVLGALLVAHRARSPFVSELVFAKGTLAGRHYGEASAPFAPRSLSMRADAAWRDAKFERICLHEGRHTFASLLLAAEASMPEVSALMGHTSIRTTVDLYGHLLPNARRDAIDRLDSLIKDAAGHSQPLTELRHSAIGKRYGTGAPQANKGGPAWPIR